MGKKSKSFALVLVALFLTSLITLEPATVKAQSTTFTSAPTIQWQKDYGDSGPYGDTNVESTSNLIQTSDGGYVFVNLGWSYQYTIRPSTLYKVDSSGNLQWNKTISYFRATTFIQTSDEGYELSGSWFSALIGGGAREFTPTLIKTDSQGNIQWIQNYSSVPDLGSAPTLVQTSDSGFVYGEQGSLIKTDSNNNTQWIINLTYTGGDGTAPLEISSIIETSNGALAVLGVGYNLFDNPRTGRIYLIKTEPFLPLPSVKPLPTPMQTPTPTPSQVSDNNFVLIVPFVFVVLVIVIIYLLFYRTHRKTISQNKPNV